MRKSTKILIGLLALSIASCHRRVSRYPPQSQWGQTDAYVSTDGGYGYNACNSMFPFWFYYSYMFHPGFGYGYYPGVMYYSRSYYSHGYYGGRSYGRGGGWAVSERGSTYRGGSLRGGFGASGRASGS